MVRSGYHETFCVMCSKKRMAISCSLQRWPSRLFSLEFVPLELIAALSMILLSTEISIGNNFGRSLFRCYFCTRLNEARAQCLSRLDQRTCHSHLRNKILVDHRDIPYWIAFAGATGTELSMVVCRGGANRRLR